MSRYERMADFYHACAVYIKRLFDSQVVDIMHGMARYLVLGDEDEGARATLLERAVARHGLPPARSFRALFDMSEPPARGYEVAARTLRRGPASVLLVSPVHRVPTMTHAEFDAHWRDRHGPLALTHHVGMTLYEQHTVRRAIGDVPAYDGIGVLGFATVADFEERLFDDAEGQRIIARDTARFIDVTRLEVAIMKNHPDPDHPDPDHPDLG